MGTKIKPQAVEEGMATPAPSVPHTGTGGVRAYAILVNDRLEQTYGPSSLPSAKRDWAQMCRVWYPYEDVKVVDLQSNNQALHHRPATRPRPVKLLPTRYKVTFTRDEVVAVFELESPSVGTAYEDAEQYLADPGAWSHESTEEVE